MAATRQNPVFQIYQDNFAHTSNSHNASKPRPQLQPSAMPLQPLGNLSSNADAIPNAALPGSHHGSPLKSQAISPQLQQFPQMGYIPIAPPMQNDVYGVSPVKQPHMQQYQDTLPSQPMFSTFNSNLEAYPRQYHIVASSQHESSDFPMPSYSRRQNLKRSFSDAATLNDRPSKKLRLDELPNPEEMPHIEDDGNKPGYSYAQMIGMAILRAPNRRLTLAQIYEWISTNFAFYREDPKQGWHNSIRHNLSLNKAFKKQERPKGDAGKGSYWIIEPGMEAQFFKEKIRKNPNLVNMGLQPGMRADIQVMAQPLAEALTPSWSVPVAPVPDVSRSQPLPILPELSSDATLPASDPALNEDPSNEGEPQSPQQASSPNPVMNSSPPVARNHHRTISSPVNKRPVSNKLHRRSNTAVDDSGYWTELSSSVRKTRNGIMLTSEINIEPPNGTRGRAEDAIRRILSSPRATPNPRRLSTLSELDPLSSPIRHSPVVGKNPATPAVIFKKPALRPPQSVSPNTQLQRHRAQMLEYQDSPLKAAGLPDIALPGLSPYSSLPTFRNDFDDQFLIFEDSMTATPFTPGLASSPLKSVRKPSLVRSNTSAGILRDASSYKLNTKTPTKSSTLKPAFKPVSLAGSPLKKSMTQVADDDFFIAFDEGFDENTFMNDDIFDTTLINDENSPDFGDDGVDLVKGFAYIGKGHETASSKRTGQHNGRKTSLGGTRPPLGMRSNTSAF